MKKVYYNVEYVNGNSKEQNGVSFITNYNYSSPHCMVVTYTTRIYYERRWVPDPRCGIKEADVPVERKVPATLFPTYVEKIEDKYYDIVTGMEVACYDGKSTPKLQFKSVRYEDINTIYKFLTSMTPAYISKYKERFNEAYNSAMNEYAEEERKINYIDSFRDNNDSNFTKKMHY